MYIKMFTPAWQKSEGCANQPFVKNEKQTNKQTKEQKQTTTKHFEGLKSETSETCWGEMYCTFPYNMC